MTAKDILLYQVGNRGAIERVAASPATFLTGLLLVLITGIPRNYDQIYFLESWRWLYGPLAFSLVSGSFVYSVGRLPSAGEGKRFHQWLGFMGLFWMTAPMAWIYAIPVERMLPSRGAAIANLCLLGLVSLGRVLLLSRVISIVQKSLFRAALVRVLFAASTELWLVSFFGGFIGRAVLAGMAGMLNSPEEDIVFTVAEHIAVVGWVFALLLGWAKSRMEWNESSSRMPPAALLKKLEIKMAPALFQPVPHPGVGRPAGWVLIGSMLAWVGVAVAPQIEQRRFAHYEELTRAEGYRAGLAYLSTLQRRQLPPQRRLRPSPYEFEAWSQLPACFSAMDGSEAPWVANYFRGALDAMMGHRFIRNRDLMMDCLETIARLDQNHAWIQARQAKIVNAFGRYIQRGEDSLATRLEALGVALPPEYKQQVVEPHEQRTNASIEQLGAEVLPPSRAAKP